MIKLLALDLDGTVVNEDIEISAKTLETLDFLINKTDVRVVIATGRMHPSAAPFAFKIGTKEPVISYQGAMTRDIHNGNKILDHRPIPQKLAIEIARVLNERGFGLNVYINDQLYTNHSDSVSTTYARLSGITPTQTDDITGVITSDASKMMVIHDDGIEELLEELIRDFGSSLNFCMSRSNFLEIIDTQASKWNAVKGLAERWGIPDSDIMAIGDQGNDVSMIQAAGVGVAMGNAPKHIQAMANYVTETVDNDGVVKAVEKYILCDW